MKGNCRRALVSLLAAVFLLISVTYAWIMDSGVLSGRFVQLDFSGEDKAGKLRIASVDIDVQFLCLNDENEYVVRTRAEGPLVLEGMVPNDMVPFKIRFFNTSGESQAISLSIVGITTDNPGILGQLYFGATGGDGYANATDINVEKPDSQFICLESATQRTTGEFDLRVYDSIIVPPMTEDRYVELDCYFWFSRLAEIEFEGTTVSIANFRVII